MDFEAEYLAFIAAARARNEKLGLELKKRKGVFGAHHFLRSSYQVHHIIPRRCGGQNTQDNVVALTPDEHVVAHFLYNVSVQQQKNKRDNYCFGVPELNSILKFIPNLLSSFVIKYDFKRNKVADSVSGTIEDISKFLCVLKDEADVNWFQNAAKVINSCFRRHHMLCVNDYVGKVRFADLNFAA